MDGAVEGAGPIGAEVVDVVGGRGAGGAAGSLKPKMSGGGGGGAADGGAGSAGTVNVPLHSGHFISCPAYCSGTVSIFWQFGHSRFMDGWPVSARTKGFPSVRAAAFMPIDERVSGKATVTVSRR